MELINLASPRQVTLLIATPHPPDSASGGIMSESSEAWVALAGHTLNEIDPTTGGPGLRVLIPASEPSRSPIALLECLERDDETEEPSAPGPRHCGR